MSVFILDGFIISLWRQNNHVGNLPFVRCFASILGLAGSSLQDYTVSRIQRLSTFYPLLLFTRNDPEVPVTTTSNHSHFALS